MSREMKTRVGALVAALAMGMSVLPIARNEGIARRSLGPSGTPKRNQERARKAMAQRSRMINRMRRK